MTPYHNAGDIFGLMYNAACEAVNVMKTPRPCSLRCHKSLEKKPEGNKMLSSCMQHSAVSRVHDVLLTSTYLWSSLTIITQVNDRDRIVRCYSAVTVGACLYHPIPSCNMCGAHCLQGRLIGRLLSVITFVIS